MKTGMIHIFKKEFKNYFVSPIAYIVIGIFLLITGYLFFSTFFLNNQATLRGFFSYLPLMFCFIIPAITMHLFSEEMSVGSYELLLTMPVSFIDVIMGKFLAALAFSVLSLAPTLSYVISIGLVSTLDIGPVICGYLGAIMLAGSYSAIGLFASSLTKSQIVAFIIAVSICFGLWLFDQVLTIVPINFVLIINILQGLASNYHFQNIAKGVLDLRDVLYFGTICFIAVYATKMVMEEKK